MSGSHLEPTWLQFHVLRTYRRAAMWRRKAEGERRQRFLVAIIAQCPKICQDAAKTSQQKPRWVQDGPKTDQDRPKTSQDRHRQAQDRPETGPRQTKTGQDRAKIGSRQGQDRPRQAPDSLLTALDWPRQRQDGPRQAPRADLERFLVFRSHAKPWFFL